MDKTMALIELGGQHQLEDWRVVTGERLPTEILNIYPFASGVNLKLDAESAALIGQDIITVTEAELLTDCPETPLPATPLPETTTDMRNLRITPYITLIDLKRMNDADLLAVAVHAEAAQKNRQFRSHWEKITEWVSELRGTELPPPGAQLELFEVSHAAS